MNAAVAPLAAPRVASELSVSDALLDALHRLGVAHAFGVMGGAIAPFFRALHHGPIRCLNFRHEGGAAFAAVEASLATRRPVLVFTTAGPGLANALAGMHAARWDGAHVIFVTAATSAANRGRVATQETSAATFGGGGLFLPGGGLHYATSIDHPAQLGPVVAQLSNGLQRAGGFVAHLSLPIDVQGAAAAGRARLVEHGDAAPMCSPQTVAHHASLIAGKPLTMWIGFGARHAAAEVRRLAELTGARVMCSPRGKGIFPEDHPQFIGVTGLGGHPEVDELLAADRPAHTLVLGTRMGESTSFWMPELTPAEAFIHVDTDAAAFGAAFPEIATHGAVADVGRYCAALADALAGAARVPARLTPRALPPRPSPRAHGPVRPQHLFAEVQRVFVDGSDAWIMAESGNAFCWSSHLLRFQAPGRYRVSTGYGSMGHATTAVVGAALARRGKAVALVGDGAMMMANELHAAVQYGADAVWIVLNDARYLICQQGMSAMGWEPFACDLPRVDFAALACAIGAGGERVTGEAELGAALERAAAVRGPWVIDVNLDPGEIAPSGRRNRSLMQQGFNDDRRR